MSIIQKIFTPNSHIVNLSGKKNVINNISGINNTTESVSGNKIPQDILIGKKIFKDNIDGIKNIYTNFVAYLNNFDTRNTIYINVKISSFVQNTFKKFSRLFVSSNIYMNIDSFLTFVEKLSIVASSQYNINIMNLINKIIININRVIDLSYDESKINFNEVKNALNIRSIVGTNIIINDFYKTTTAFISMFYKTSGVLNYKLIKKYAIENNINYSVLLSMLKEIDLDVRNLIDVTLYSGANFQLLKKIYVQSVNSIGFNLSLMTSTKATMQEYVDSSMDELSNFTINQMFNKYE